MKLRSGKVLHYKKLPEILEAYLDKGIGLIKIIIGDNSEAANELLMIIGAAPDIDARHSISSKVNEIFANKEKSVQNHQSEYALSATSGALLRLIIGNSDIYEVHHISPHKYHDLIQEKINQATEDLLEKFSSDEAESGYSKKTWMGNKSSPTEYASALMAVCNILSVSVLTNDKDKVYLKHYSKALKLEQEAIDTLQRSTVRVSDRAKSRTK